MLELVLILLPKVRNIFLSFPVSGAKGEKSTEAVLYTQMQKREQHPVQLITDSSEIHTHGF